MRRVRRCGGLVLAMSLAALGGLTGLAGCGRGSQGRPAAAATAARPQPAPKDVEIQEDPVKTGVATGDSVLADRVRAQLAGDPDLRAQRIEVDAEAGRVTLWGHVARADQKTAAAAAARRSPGVTSVVNLIKVDDRPAG